MNENEPLMKQREGEQIVEIRFSQPTGEDYSGCMCSGYRAIVIEMA